MIDLSWTGGMPETWKAIPLKSRFDFGKGLSITKADLVEEGVPVLSYGQIHSKNNPKASIPDALVRYIPKAIADSAPDSLAIRNGFIFADTSEDLDGCGNCNYVDRDDVYGGYHTVVLKPKKSVETDNKYLSYLFQTDAWRYQLRKELTEVKLYSVSQKALKSTWIIVPPHDEKEAIVRYLDSKCSAIDEAIERHKMIIEKLEDYRTKVVSHAVMHGLNPGVEEKRYPVIGLCPSHWKVSRLKFSASVVRGGSPRPIENYITDKNGLNWIKIGDATGNGKYINSTKQQIIPEGLSKTRLVHPGTLLLTNSMSFGHPYVLNIDGCIHDGWLAFSDYDGIEQDYLYYYLMSDSAMNQFVRTVEGSVVNNLNIEKVKNSLITIPPIGEQKEIVAYLDKQNAIIDDAVRTKEAIVTKLEEYRKSIIYNAVTGKIDCREATK